jgi:hypothetical protein
MCVLHPHSSPSVSGALDLAHTLGTPAIKPKIFFFFEFMQKKLVTNPVIATKHAGLSFSP